MVMSTVYTDFNFTHIIRLFGPMDTSVLKEM